MKRGPKRKSTCRVCAANGSGTFCQLGYLRVDNTPPPQQICPRPLTEKAMIDEILNNRNGY